MKHVIFDFDGTLVDSLPVVIGIAHQLMPELDLSAEKQAKLRELSLRQGLKQVGVPYWRLLGLMIQGKRLLGQRLDRLKVFKGIHEVIKALHQAGYQISVVSSNSEDNIRQVLKREGIEKYFAGVYGNVGLFSKTRAFRVVMKDQNASADQVVYIGDEVRDIEAAHRAGIQVISVSWGYNGQKILAKTKPDFLVHTPHELQQTILKQVAK